MRSLEDYSTPALDGKWIKYTDHEEQHQKDLQVMVVQQAEIKKFRDALEYNCKIAHECKKNNVARNDYINAGSFRDIVKKSREALKESEQMRKIDIINREIKYLEEKRANVQMLRDLVKIKKPAVRSKFDYCFINFWKNDADYSVCDIELNKKESELLRRFLYAIKKRAIK